MIFLGDYYYILISLKNEKLGTRTEALEVFAFERREREDNFKIDFFPKI